MTNIKRQLFNLWIQENYPVYFTIIALMGVFVILGLLVSGIFYIVDKDYWSKVLIGTGVLFLISRVVAIVAESYFKEELLEKRRNK